MDRLSPEAAAIGAVNTVVLRNGTRVGHNTDCRGFAEAFRRGMAHAPFDDVLLIGAGGAGLAVAYALLGLGAKRLSVFDILPAKAAALVRRLEPLFGADRLSPAGDLETAVRQAQGVVQASPTGMAKFPGSPIPAAWLRPSLWVADIVYFPVETALLRDARAAGCRTLDGTRMAIFQAARAFELITGAVPDADEMAGHFDAA
jgi:shikimate dehydrogenase